MGLINWLLGKRAEKRAQRELDELPSALEVAAGSARAMFGDRGLPVRPPRQRKQGKRGEQ